MPFVNDFVPKRGRAGLNAPLHPLCFGRVYVDDRVDALRSACWAAGVLKHTGMTPGGITKIFGPEDRPAVYGENGIRRNSNFFYRYLKGEAVPSMKGRKGQYSLFDGLAQDENARLALAYWDHWIWGVLRADLTLAKIRRSVIRFGGLALQGSPSVRLEMAVDKILSEELSVEFWLKLAGALRWAAVAQRADLQAICATRLEQTKGVLQGDVAWRHVANPMLHFLLTEYAKDTPLGDRSIKEEVVNAVLNIVEGDGYAEIDQFHDRSLSAPSRKLILLAHLELPRFILEEGLGSYEESISAVIFFIAQRRNAESPFWQYVAPEQIKY